MKKDIHPKYYEEAKIACSCGHQFSAGSTLPQLKVEICSACHPFYTGQQKLVDTEGRVEKFEKRRAHANKAAQTEAKKKLKIKEEEQKRREQPKTLRDMLKDAGRTSGPETGS